MLTLELFITDRRDPWCRSWPTASAMRTIVKTRSEERKKSGLPIQGPILFFWRGEEIPSNHRLVCLRDEGQPLNY
jgi:hypothetical protein